VRRLDAEGRLSTALGTGEETYGEPNAPAAAFGVHHPLAIAVTAGDEWLVAGYHDPRVLRVDGARRVRVLAGFGGFGDTGDGGAATLAALDAPAGVARDASGHVYVVDELHHRVRRVRPDGVIEAFAGDGTRGYAGDGGPARAAQLNGPMRVAVSPDGAVFVCDAGNHAIRRVGADGVITTVAGTGAPGFSGDGSDATDAMLYRPLDVALLDDGGFLIADSDNSRVRRVFGDGRIDTLVGTSSAGFSGDGGPAREARLHTPWGVAVDGEGRVWIADTDNHRVRRVEASALGGARAR
jgi:DNA-binding beta-propeller fold protein YncE